MSDHIPKRHLDAAQTNMEGYDNHQIWVISNKHRTHGTASNFTVALDGAHHGAHIHSLAVKSVALTNFFQNVPEGYQTFYYDIVTLGGGIELDNTINLSFDKLPGHFTAAEIVAVMKTHFELWPEITTIDFALGTQAGTFSLGATMDADFGTVITFPDLETLASRGHTTSLNYLLGANTAPIGGINGTEIPGVGGPFYTNNAINLSGPKATAVCCSQLAPGVGQLGDKKGELDLLALVPLTGGAGAAVHYVAPDVLGSIYYPEHTTDTHQLTFSLRDELGQEMVLPDNADVLIELRVIFQRS